mmetsp:Transcript_29409/g.57577  ORF Transcript_29409/g.57577 Transcript_29409/m.57577 type:complete len:295 (-) Transcript_29409:598-1482(-)
MINQSTDHSTPIAHLSKYQFVSSSSSCETLTNPGSRGGEREKGEFLSPPPPPSNACQASPRATSTPSTSLSQKGARLNPRLIKTSSKPTRPRLSFILGQNTATVTDTASNSSLSLNAAKSLLVIGPALAALGLVAERQPGGKAVVHLLGEGRGGRGRGRAAGGLAGHRLLECLLLLGGGRRHLGHGVVLLRGLGHLLVRLPVELVDLARRDIEHDGVDHGGSKSLPQVRVDPPALHNRRFVHVERLLLRVQLHKPPLARDNIRDAVELLLVQPVHVPDVAHPLLEGRGEVAVAH